jgi:hypothetical protein
MNNTNWLEELRIESRLSESVCIRKLDDGSKVAAINGIVMDYPTFCVFVLNRLSSGERYYHTLNMRLGQDKTLQAYNADLFKEYTKLHVANNNAWAPAFTSSDLDSNNLYLITSAISTELYRCLTEMGREKFVSRFIEMLNS